MRVLATAAGSFSLAVFAANCIPLLEGALLPLSCVLAALCAAAWVWERARALPPGVIGYADAPAKLFVAGTPALLYVLPALAGLAALAAAAAFLYLKYREKRDGR